MLPDGCVETRGSLDHVFSTILNCWMCCTYEYQEPNEVHLSQNTKQKIFPDVSVDAQQITFRNAMVVVNNDIPDGIVELRNTGKPDIPHHNGRVIFNDFPGPFAFMETA